MGGGDRFPILLSKKEGGSPTLSSTSYERVPSGQQSPIPPVLSPLTPLVLPVAFSHSNVARDTTTVPQVEDGAAIQNANHHEEMTFHSDDAAAANFGLETLTEAADPTVAMPGLDSVPILLDSSGNPVPAELWWNSMIDDDLLNSNLLDADFNPLIPVGEPVDQIAATFQEFQQHQGIQQVHPAIQPQGQMAEPSSLFPPPWPGTILPAQQFLQPQAVQTQPNVQDAGYYHTQPNTQTERVDPPFMFTLPPHIFNMNKLTKTSLDIMKLYEYIPLMVQTAGLDVPHEVKRYLFEKIDETQLHVLRRSGLTAIADRIESLEYDARELRQLGEYESFINVRTAIRDYRIGIIQLPSNGDCHLYHKGENLGLFSRRMADDFLPIYISRTTGPVWREEGNQPRTTRRKSANAAVGQQLHLPRQMNQQEQQLHYRLLFNRLQQALRNRTNDNEPFPRPTFQEMQLPEQDFQLPAHAVVAYNLTVQRFPRNYHQQ
ncbi:hypothetical protein TWF694_005619 [Orbilia ellipsospora]|uniref:Uncharacterized protein n=1 Tax=Orbilia ellipsospora TaxID=2528407 RepID=A0AAV9WV79_9PEZI